MPSFFRQPRMLMRSLAVLSLLGVAAIFSPSAAAQSGPRTTPEIVTAAADAAAPIPAGPYQPTWDSLKANYAVPEWFRDAKFGIFMHWGLFSVPAHGSEWYEKYMYGNAAIMQWHTDHFGPPEKFGYKDFIPLFTAAKWNPDAWALLFKKAGAKYVVPIVSSCFCKSGEHPAIFANLSVAL